jgi:catechol-2,3-dioxygenase
MSVGIPTKLGHIALRVRDLERSVAFYRDVVGLPLREKYEKVAFLGVREDASHEIALFQLENSEAPGPEATRVGMYHMAWEMASFEDLQAFHKRLLDSNAKIAGYSNRQSNVMFLDPDGNELEALWEPTPEEAERFKAAGTPVPTLAHS